MFTAVRDCIYFFMALYGNNDFPLLCQGARYNIRLLRA